MRISKYFSVLFFPAICLTGCTQTPAPVTNNASSQMMEAAQNPDALARIGQAALQTGDNNTAITFYNRAMALSPHRIDLQLGYAEALTASGRINDALGIMRPLTTQYPNNNHLALVTARLLIKAGHPREAINLLQNAHTQAPTDVPILVALGIALDTLGDQQTAQGYYQQALALKPDDVAARTDMALSLALSGSYSQALSILRPLRSELAGTEQAAHQSAVENALALVYGLMGDHATASTILRHHLSSQQAQENLSFYNVIRQNGHNPPSL